MAQLWANPVQLVAGSADGYFGGVDVPTDLRILTSLTVSPERFRYEARNMVRFFINASQ
jgi:hypothetical protein